MDMLMPFDKLKEECGIFGIYSNDEMDVTHDVYYALYALQHRGQESCGIAVNDHGKIMLHKDLGLVNEVFNEMFLCSLKGQMAIGHVRYSTTGNSNRENAQPLLSKHMRGYISVAHNGNLVNTVELREELETSGAIFQTTSDTEVI